jgi:peptidase E
MNKNVFLAGGGSNEELKSFNKLFIEKLKENNINTIFFVPFGKRREFYKRDFEKTKDIFRHRISNFVFMNDVSKLFNIEGREKDIALYVGGGNIMRILSCLRGQEYYGIIGRETELNQTSEGNRDGVNVEKIIKNFINNGGLYYGNSSGSVICGKSANTSRVETANEKRVCGLDVLNGKSVATHYIDAEKTFYDDFEKEACSAIIRIRQNEGLYFNESAVEINDRAKKQFIARQIEHVRIVQDAMILLEANIDKLPFEIKNWQLLQRAMCHDLDKFYDHMAGNFCQIEEYHSNKRNNISNDHIDESKLYDCCNAHYSTQPHHSKYHIDNNLDYSNIDICEMCCDIFAQSVRNGDIDGGKKYCVENIFNVDVLFKKHSDKILSLLDMLNCMFPKNRQKKELKLNNN